MEQNNMTILIMGFDLYNDVWDGFMYCKKKYWADCEYPVVMVTCTETSVPDGVDRVITTGVDIEWSARLHMALEKITTPYVLLFLEDLYIDRSVDSKQICNCLDLMNKYESIGHLRLMPDVPYQQDFLDNSAYGEYLPGHAYRISTHPSIWKKEYLLKLTKEIMDAWSFEYEMSFKSAKYREKCLCSKDTIISFTNTIWRQKWTKEGMELCKRENILIDLNRRGKHGVFSNIKISINNFIFKVFGADKITKIILWKKGK